MPSNETDSVNDILGQILDNSTAFDSLTELMTRLGADDVSLEYYIIILFNNSEAVDLLVASVGSDADAQQAVFDAIGDNTDAQVTFLLALGANLNVNLDGSGSSDGSDTDYSDYTIPAGFTIPSQ